MTAIEWDGFITVAVTPQKARAGTHTLTRERSGVYTHFFGKTAFLKKSDCEIGEAEITNAFHKT